MDGIQAEVKRSILEQKIQLYAQSYYSHQVDAEVARDLEDEAMEKSAKDNMRRARKAQKLVEAKLRKLPKPTAEEEPDDDEPGEESGI